MMNRSMRYFVCGLIVFGAIQVDLEAKNYGMKPLKPRERLHLETKVHKAVQVNLNELGAQRVQEHMDAHGINETAQAVSSDKEFILVKTSTAKAAAMMATASATLPLSVNNSTLPSFPPIGNQEDLGACVAYGSTYYQASHELGLLNGINNKTSSKGILSPNWTYNLLDGGENVGLSWVLAYELLATNGAPSILAFPFTTNFAIWDVNGSDWVAATYNRMSNYVLIPGLGGASQNLTAIKTALVNGHVVTFGTFIDSWVFTTIKKDPQGIDNSYVNQMACTYMNGTEGAHFVTIVGYDDNLWIDINGNGEVDAGERGAFLVANSWGTTWGNKGYIWISYDAFLNASAVAGGPTSGRVAACTTNNSVISVVPKAQNYTPSLVAEFTLTQSYRDLISVQGGISLSTQTSPVAKITDVALNYQGGNLTFGGTYPYSADTGSFALDLTDLLVANPAMESQRFYLQFAGNGDGAPLTLNSFSLLDLTNKNAVGYASAPHSFGTSAGTVYIDYNYSDPTINPISPTITLTQPPTNVLQSGVISPVVITSDVAGIANVTCLVDGTTSVTMNQDPGQWVGYLNTVPLANGTHTLLITSIDNLGNTAELTSTFEVSN